MSAPSTCTKCGAPLRPGVRFCTTCGSPVEAGPGPAPTVQAATPARWLPLTLVSVGVVLLLVVVAVTMYDSGEQAPPPQTDTTPANVPPPAPASQAVESPPTPVPAPTPSPTYERFENGEFGFAVELPAHWVSKLEKGDDWNAIVFSGAPGSEEYDATINFQFVHRTPADTLNRQADSYQRQLAGLSGFKLLSREEGNIAGRPAVRMVSTFQSPGGLRETMKQEQLIVEGGKYYYWVAYTAPAAIYDRYHAAVEHAQQTLEIKQ
jgi:hypothetical protein